MSAPNAPANTPAPVIRVNEPVKVNEPVSPVQVLVLRGTIVGCGLLGVYLVARNSKVFARFKHINEIPEQCYRKETKLKGVVRALDSYGTLKVEHQPEISLPRFLQSKKRPTDLLRLRLAGLDVSKAGVEYLIKDLRLKDRPVYFNVVKRTANDSDTADADVTIKKSLLGAVNLNVDLVRKGYARVYTLEHPPHYEALQKNAVYSRLVTRLLTSERVAEKRGLGIWERESWVESVQSLPHTAGQIVRASSIVKFFVLLGRVLYDLLQMTINILRHGYYFGVTTAGYAAGAYRTFGNKVDQLSKFYDQQKLRLQRGGGKSVAAQSTQQQSPNTAKKD